MIVDKDKFLKILDNSNSKLEEFKIVVGLNFSKEIINSVGSEDRIKASMIIEQIQEELNTFDYNSILMSKGFFRRIFVRKISTNDITRFFTNKKNTLINLSTSLVLTQKELFKTLLFLEEELSSNKDQLKQVVVTRTQLIRTAETLKNTILDITDLDEYLALELNNKKLDLLKDFENKIRILTTNIVVLNQNITSSIILIKTFKKFNDNIEELVKTVFPKWIEMFTNQVMTAEIVQNGWYEKVKEVTKESKIIDKISVVLNQTKPS